MEKYEKVLALMKAKGGKITITDPELSAVLGTAKTSKKALTYRLTVYMSYIRRFAKLEVKTIRDGRRAIGYELVRANLTTDTSSEPVWQNSKYIKDDATAVTVN